MNIRLHLALLLSSLIACAPARTRESSDSVVQSNPPRPGAAGAPIGGAESKPLFCRHCLAFPPSDYAFGRTQSAEGDEANPLAILKYGSPRVTLLSSIWAVPRVRFDILRSRLQQFHEQAIPPDRPDGVRLTLWSSEPGGKGSLVLAATFGEAPSVDCGQRRIVLPGGFIGRARDLSADDLRLLIVTAKTVRIAFRCDAALREEPSITWMLEHSDVVRESVDPFSEGAAVDAVQWLKSASGPCPLTE